MKCFLLQAAFFCMVCLCYAQHEELGGHKSSEAVQVSAVNMAASVSEENGGAAQQEHADVQNEDTGTQIERNDTVLSAEAAKLKLYLDILKVFGVYYAMAREDRIWKNRLGSFMDTRIFRLETFIAVAGTTFLSSFRLKGTEAGIKLVFGY